MTQEQKSVRKVRFPIALTDFHCSIAKKILKNYFGRQSPLIFKFGHCNVFYLYLKAYKNNESMQIF